MLLLEAKFDWLKGWRWCCDWTGRVLKTGTGTSKLKFFPLAFLNSQCWWFRDSKSNEKWNKIFTLLPWRLYAHDGSQNINTWPLLDSEDIEVNSKPDSFGQWVATLPVPCMKLGFRYNIHIPSYGEFLVPFFDLEEKPSKGIDYKILREFNQIALLLQVQRCFSNGIFAEEKDTTLKIR